ncbi:hypothetical protein [Pontibacter akesuensis]|uniref:Uncharacterized protein n=1 Tax=Pontibacter akesuensis TaxID=388950 RepID=A0A1I7GFX8_9BACT|nr:hypothetical protein [Pontibacter akesuensis]GHA57067.1 hypothetical protein GCM10007389_05950 [Pontibacter akesuensis]SFU47231.1 hypothetical protein SAMN04487941_0974 [Pontibacter akesuensis]
MKKLLIILLGTCTFACGDAANEGATEEDTDIQAGDEVRPQIEYEADTAGTFETDTASAAPVIEEQP